MPPLSVVRCKVSAPGAVLSQVLINRYLRELSTLRRVSGSSNEGVVSGAFKDLLKDWGRAQELQFVAQFAFTAPVRERSAGGSCRRSSRRWWPGGLVVAGSSRLLGLTAHEVRRLKRRIAQKVRGVEEFGMTPESDNGARFGFPKSPPGFSGRPKSFAACR